MGIYDRDYYRREGPSFLASLGGRADVCKWLIIINAGVFVLQLMFRSVTDAFVLDTAAVANGQVWRLLTYAFLHGSPLHILFNMLFLWWFGKDMEDLYGPKEFLAFYLIAAVAGGVVFEAGWVARHSGLGLLSELAPRTQLCLGASGAVTAVMVLYAFHYPARVFYFFMVPVPVWLFVAFQVAQDLFGVMGGGSGQTAYTVHLGGAAFGFAYYQMGWRMMNVLPDLRGWQRRHARPALRVYKGDEEIEEAPMPAPVSVAVPPTSDTDEHLEAKLDAVLEKMAKFGQGSLTEGEKQILLRASELYKKRRT